MHRLISGGLLHHWVVIVVSAAILVCALAVGWLMRTRNRPRLNRMKYEERWQAVQHQCAKGETWPLAVIDADKLLDQALKDCRFKGKTMGTRLVAAQRHLSDNDAVWFGHKLRNKLVHEEIPRLYKRDVQAALRGFRQALKDLGAIE